MILLVTGCTVQNNFRYHVVKRAKQKPVLKHIPGNYSKAYESMFKLIEWDTFLKPNDTAYVLLQYTLYRRSIWSVSIYNTSRNLEYWQEFGPVIKIHTDTLRMDWNKSNIMRILFGEGLTSNELTLIKRCNNRDSLQKYSRQFTDSCIEIRRLKDTGTAILLKSYRNKRGKVVSKIIG